MKVEEDLSTTSRNNSREKVSNQRNHYNKKSFEDIKLALNKTPVLICPKFDRDFILFSFASEHTFAAVLLQKNDEGYEQPIAFFSKALRDAPLKYNIMEK